MTTGCVDLWAGRSAEQRVDLQEGRGQRAEREVPQEACLSFQETACNHAAMELEDSKWHLVRALVAVGVARPGFTRTGIEPIRVSPPISQYQRRPPPRVRDEYQQFAQLFRVGSSGRSSAAPGQPSSCHDGQQLTDDQKFRRRRVVWIAERRCVFCDPTWAGWYCRTCWAQY